jgi:hypothetical protein
VVGALKGRLRQACVQPQLHRVLPEQVPRIGLLERQLTGLVSSYVSPRTWLRPPTHR